MNPWVQWEALDTRDNSYVSLDTPHKDLISYISVEMSKDNTMITYTCSFKTDAIFVFRKDGIITWKHEVPVV